MLASRNFHKLFKRWIFLSIFNNMNFLTSWHSAHQPKSSNEKWATSINADEFFSFLLFPSFSFSFKVRAKWKTNETINQFYTKNSTGIWSKCTRRSTLFYHSGLLNLMNKQYFERKMFFIAMDADSWFWLAFL